MNESLQLQNSETPYYCRESQVSQDLQYKIHDVIH